MIDVELQAERGLAQTCNEIADTAQTFGASSFAPCESLAGKCRIIEHSAPHTFPVGAGFVSLAY
jgi:hypothetical protein